MDDDRELISRVVDALLAGYVVGWFQGRFEWGPRALGNRSILADPRREEMKHRVNATVKFREPFRPFAPVILEERVLDFFEGRKAPHRQYPARYMLLVLPWRDDKAEGVPAVNHFGTGRLQTVRREWNPRYYDVVHEFGEATGVPVLLNTSFNVRGEPIVNSPADALRTFSYSQLDLLVIDRFVVSRRHGS